MAEQETEQATVETPETDEIAPESSTEETAELAGESEDEATGDETPAEPEKPKPKGGGFQKRISELTQQRRALEAQNAELQAKLEQAAKPPSEKAPSRDDFDSFEDWTDARAAYVARQEFRKQSEQAARAYQEQKQRETQTAAQLEWEARSDAAFEKHDDYGAMFEAVGTSITQDVARAIREADAGPDVVYYLGKNPKELDRVKSLTGTKAALAIGKLEERLALEAKARKSAAPTPISRSRTTGSTGTNALSDEADIKAWMKARNKQVHGS